MLHPPFPGEDPAAPKPVDPIPETPADALPAPEPDPWTAAAREPVAPEPAAPEPAAPAAGFWTPSAAPAPGPSAPTPERRAGRLLPLVVTSALLSAILASAGTAFLVGATAPPAATSAPGTATQTSTSSGSSQSTSSVTVTDPSSAIVSVAAKVSPAVVTITSTDTASNLNPFSVPSTGVGSGFIYTSNGRILTNYHVVEGASSLTVTLEDGRQLAGRVVASDPTHDLAVVAVNATGLPTVAIGDSSTLQVGQTLVAIGSPLGTFTDTVTSGILSATGRSIQVVDDQTRQLRNLTNLLQTDAAINPGNSGGPLLDLAGQVIGIDTATASSAQGIGFAIPINAAKAIMTQGTAA